MKTFFDQIKTIAIVGMSQDPTKPSNEVGMYLKNQGFTIIPVNPNYDSINGMTSYKDILAIPKEISIDVVDIFRRSEDVLPHVEEAVKRGDVHTIWMQEGIENTQAEQFASEHGLTVVMNFCLMNAHKQKAKTVI